MKAVRMHAPGGTDVMQYEDVPMPEPAPDQVRIKVAAAGVNFIDTYHRSGLYRVPLPFTLGVEVAGTVDAVGSAVQDVAVGEQVVSGFQPGGYAEYMVVAADQVVPVPAGVDLQLAAAAMLQGMTAHYLTHSTFPLQAGHTALIHAAAGGHGAAGGANGQTARRTGDWHSLDGSESRACPRCGGGCGDPLYRRGFRRSCQAADGWRGGRCSL